MAIYHPEISDIETTIESAQPEDIIYLPNEEILQPIEITNNCIIRGQENTVIKCDTPFSLKVEGVVELSNIKIENRKLQNNIGILLSNFEGLIQNVEIYSCNIGLKISNSSDFEISETKVYDCEVGVNIKDSKLANFSLVEVFECNTGFEIEGSSTVIGDVYDSQNFGLNFSNNKDLSGLSRRKFDVSITTDPPTIPDLIDIINSQLDTDLIEVYQEDSSIGVRKTTSDPIKIIINDFELFGWVSGTYSDYHIRDKNISLSDIFSEVESGLNFSIEIDKKYDYSIIINDTEYFFTCVQNSTFSSLVSRLKKATDSNNTELKTMYDVSLLDNDIRITSLTPNTMKIEEGTKDFLPYLNGFTSFPPPSESLSSEEDRDDRSHHIKIQASQSHNNMIGIRISNSDHISLEDCLVFSNSDVGVWHMPESYANNFSGEIYDNRNYGVRNTDKEHELVARQVWWGDITGPSMMGKGTGDKVSKLVIFDDWRKEGSEKDQSFPHTRDWVWRMLGYPLVRVELTEEHITDSIEMAIDRYEEFRIPEQTYHYLQASAGQTSIELPLWMSKSEVIEVIYSPHSDLFSQLTGAGESFYLTYYLQQTGGTFLSDFHIAMSYKETLEYTLGILPTYEFFTSKNADGEWRDYIRLSPKPSIPLKIGILYNRPMTEEEVDSSTWIRKYALTWAKEQLGRIRSKYASVPGPTGEMQLDGQQLIQEAQQERESLDQSVILRGPPLTFSLG